MKTVLVDCLILVFATAVWATTNEELQAVDATGHSTFSSEDGTVTITGVVLNNSENLLDGTYNAAGWMGAQWQIFVQGTGDDHAGTAVWMGQKYSKMGDVDYTESEWTAEMLRVNYDGDHYIRMGDLVQVVGHYSDYNGKVNINEGHSVSEGMDFTVKWLEASNQLPTPEVITLADVKDANDVDIFDSTRKTCGEYYQGMRVRINDVQFADPEDWAPGAEMTITDAAGRTLTVVLGLGSEFSSASNLNTTFNIVGIFNQEGSYIGGYQLWVARYDGGTDLLGVTDATQVGGDANLDGVVDVGDLGILAANYGTMNEADWSKGDFTGDGIVDVGDLGVLAANYGYGTSRADLAADTAKVFKTVSQETNFTDEVKADSETDSTFCNEIGLSLIICFVFMGLMLVNVNEWKNLRS